MSTKLTRDVWRHYNFGKNAVVAKSESRDIVGELHLRTEVRDIDGIF